VERRLAAIVAAGMVGYSRLMAANEERVLARQAAHRKELIDPSVFSHHGRIANDFGDGVLVEFASVIDAVECSVAIQNGMTSRNADVPEDRRIAFRLGINLGDVLIDGDDMFGSAVCVAARAEALADPGGICISRAVRDQIRDRLDLRLEDLDEVAVKNIARPVRVFKIMLGEGPSPAH